MKLFPIINTEGVEDHILKEFINNFSYIYDVDAEEWLNFNIDKLKPYFLKAEISPLYDTIDMVPFILYSYINEGKRIVPNMIDEITRKPILLMTLSLEGMGYLPLIT